MKHGKILTRQIFPPCSPKKARYSLTVLKVPLNPNQSILLTPSKRLAKSYNNNNNYYYYYYYYYYYNNNNRLPIRCHWSHTLLSTMFIGCGFLLVGEK